MGDLQWRNHRYHRNAFLHGVKAGMVSASGLRWLASYWGDLPDIWAPAQAAGDRRALIGAFLSADEAQAAVEERHLGTEACE